MDNQKDNAARNKKNGNAVNGWFARFSAWRKLKRLESELRDSEKFQKDCEEIHCPNLAQMEENYRAELQQKITQLKPPEHKT